MLRVSCTVKIGAKYTVRILLIMLAVLFNCLSALNNSVCFFYNYPHDLFCLKAQWHMEQAAIKSGAMGPEGRSRAANVTYPVDDAAEGGATHNLGATAHYSGGGNIRNIVGEADTKGGGGVTGGGGGTGPGEPPNGDSLEQIYQSTRMWCRTLRRSPNAMEALIAFAKKNPRPHSGILFNQYLSDLTGIMYRRLSTTVEEEVRENNIMNGWSLFTSICFAVYRYVWRVCHVRDDNYL